MGAHRSLRLGGNDECERELLVLVLLPGNGWQKSLGLVFSQLGMNFASLLTKASGFSCLF